MSDRTTFLQEFLRDQELDPTRTGLLVVDHGSRRTTSNDMLLDVVALFQRITALPIVEPAHMELAEPSIATAFQRCVQQGCELVIVYPYFLLPGRHWNEDIPRLARAAAEQHPGVRYVVPAPLGIHDLMVRVMEDRIANCLNVALGNSATCDICQADARCRFDS